jgi:hypothetical protein
MDNKFIMEPKISFKECRVYNNNNINSIKIQLEKINIKHVQFMELINNIYDEISVCIELDNNINIYNINNPLKSNFPNKDKYNLYITINNSTKIYNYDNNKQIGLDMLYNTSFIGYPIFYSPNININTNIGYINFSLYKLYVKINKNMDNNNIEYEPDSQNIINAMNEY